MFELNVDYTTKCFAINREGEFSPPNEAVLIQLEKGAIVYPNDEPTLPGNRMVDVWLNDATGRFGVRIEIPIGCLYPIELIEHPDQTYEKVYRDGDRKAFEKYKCKILY
jgi:hypothetical protein